MARVKVLVFALANRTGESHRMLEVSGCRLILGQVAGTPAARWPKGAKPAAEGAAVGQEGDTTVTVSPRCTKGSGQER